MRNICLLAMLAALATAFAAQAQYGPGTPVPPADPRQPDAADSEPAQSFGLSPTTTHPAPPPPDQPTLDQVQQQLAAALHYPAAAKAAGEQGQATVRFELDRDGHIFDPHITRDSGSAALDAEALDVFKRIGAFHFSAAPGQGRFDVAQLIDFRLLHERQRDTHAAADAPEGELRPNITPLERTWRAALVEAIGSTWQHPEPGPEQYKLLLHLLLAPDGKLREASLRRGSGSAAVDASALDAVRAASLPLPAYRGSFSMDIQLCLAQFDHDCAAEESTRQSGTAVLVRAYVPDSVNIVTRTGRNSSYFAQVGRIIAANVRYPAVALWQREDGSIIVHVTIRRDGTITGVKLLQPASFDPLNAEARDVFSRLVRFPRVPDGISPGVDTFELLLPIYFVISS